MPAQLPEGGTDVSLKSDNLQFARWYSVPSHVIASVEHPFVIHNIAKAVDSLGGPRMVAKVLCVILKSDQSFED